MKKNLIYHSHVTTSQSKKVSVKVKTDTTNTTCFLDRVSRDGLTLSCDTETLNKLIPNKASIAPKDPISLSTCFTLDQDIQAKCRVIFARRLSKDKFIIELKFVDIDEMDMHSLDGYIERTLRLGTSSTEELNIESKTQVIEPEVYKINEDRRMAYSKVA